MNKRNKIQILQTPTYIKPKQRLTIKLKTSKKTELMKHRDQITRKKKSYNRLINSWLDDPPKLSTKTVTCNSLLNANASIYIKFEITCIRPNYLLENLIIRTRLPKLKPQTKLYAS